MSRDKQIEEMNELDEIAKILYEANGDSYDTTYQHDCEILAEVIYNAGYRKSTDVAEEIFAEIEDAMFNNHCVDDGTDYPTPHYLEELKDDIAEDLADSGARTTVDW
jgi:hypothetical protein